MGSDQDTLIDETTETGVVYVGQAARLSPESSPVWRIKKVDSTTDTAKVSWADGVTTYTKVWDDRTSYTYRA
jgi:hypothetical protein